MQEIEHSKQEALLVVEPQGKIGVHSDCSKLTHSLIPLLYGKRRSVKELMTLIAEEPAQLQLLELKHV